MYTGFAQVYDTFMDNIPYEEWAEYIVMLLRENGVRTGNITELGCGTGKITRLLAKEGYKLTGIDISEDMLEIARKYKDNITYMNMDMSELHLPNKAAAVISVCDSMNYLIDSSDMYSTVKGVYDHLKAGGVFIFDLKSEYFYRTKLGDNTFAEHTDDATLIWENAYYDEDMINEYNLTIFVRNKKNLYEKFEETHLQKAYNCEIIVDLLKKMDFSEVMVYNAFTKKVPGPRCERYYFVCKK